jgi:outer membrane protein TolC
MQGGVLADAAEATYDIARQAAIDRLVAAFTEKLRLDADVAAEREAVVAQELKLRATQRLFQSEKASRVDLRSAEAAMAQERAKAAESEAALGAANRELERLTQLDWNVPLPQPADWRAAAAALAAGVDNRLTAAADGELENHPGVVSARLKLEAADWEVNKRQSDHSPTLDLVASSSEGTSASDVVIGRYSKTKSVGLQLTIPLYAGGAVTSGVREGVALRDKARHDLDNMRRLVANDRQRAAAMLRAAVLNLTANREADEAAELTLRQTQLGAEAGLSSAVELGDAVAKRSRALASLVAAVAKVVAAYSQHRLAQGGLDSDDLAEFSRLLRN